MKLKRSNLVLDKELKLHHFIGSDEIKYFIEERFKGKNVLVYFDPDVDGLISGLFACKLLSAFGIKYSWYINTNRDHGFTLDIERVKGMGIICVDFLIPENQLKELVDAGCDVLSMDHHDNGEHFIEYTSECGNRGIVINNQFSEEDVDGRYLSGAGVVFESICNCYPDFNDRENRALVGLTLLTDIRDIENINARLYLQELYMHPCKGYIGYLIDCTLGEIDYGFGVPRLDRNYVDYSLSPIINSCLRFNQQEMAVDFILGSGFIDKNYHKRQKELIKDLKENSKVISFSHLSIVIIDQSKFAGEDEGLLSNFVGLLASQFLDGTHSVIAYLVDGSRVGRASFRGRFNGLNYLDKLHEVVNGIGHGSAFGIKGLKPNKALFERVNDICREVESLEDFSTKYVKVPNLSVFVNNQKAYDMGVENIFCLSQNRNFIVYTGNNVKVRRSGANYKELNIDGVTVMCFDNMLEPSGDFILPTIERGVLRFYLDKKFDGK